MSTSILNNFNGVLWHDEITLLLDTKMFYGLHVEKLVCHESEFVLYDTTTSI